MLRGFRDKWEVPIAKIQKTLDRGVELIEKTINYLDDVHELTTKASRLADKLDGLAEKEAALKELEAEKLKLELDALRAKGDEKGCSSRPSDPGETP